MVTHQLNKIMNRKLIITNIALSVLFGFFITHKAQAVTPPAGFTHVYEDQDMYMYTYLSSDTIPIPANQGSMFTRNTFQKPRAIIIPKDATNIDTTYIHFHGMNFTNQVTRDEKVSAQTEEQLDSLFDSKKDSQRSLASKAKALKDSGKNAVIFFPRLYQSGKTLQNFSKAEFDSFYKEAKQKLKSIPGVNYTESLPIVTGHSAGGHTIWRLLEKNYKVQAAIFFDACYSNWCKDAVQAGSTNNYFIYYSNLINPGTITDSNNAYKVDTDKVKLVETIYSHPGVLNKCFEDHLTNNLCNGGNLLSNNSITSLSTQPQSTGESANNMTLDEVRELLQVPSTKINIPGLNFSTKEEISRAVTDEAGNFYIHIPFLAEYIATIYKYGVVVAGVIAIVMIMNNGFKIAISGANPEKIKDGKKRIGQIFIGLLLIVGSYLILYIINPQLLTLKSLKILYMKQLLVEDALLATDTHGLSPTQIATLTAWPQNIQQLQDLKPKDQYNCDPEEIREIARAYAVPNICLKSNTCALFASSILRMANCDIKLKGSSTEIGKYLVREEGWQEIQFAEETTKKPYVHQILSNNDLANLPVGVLFKPPHHAALHVGDGIVVESSYNTGIIKSIIPKSIWQPAGFKYVKQPDADNVDKYFITHGVCPIMERNTYQTTVCNSCSQLWPIAWHRPDTNAPTSKFANHYIYESPPLTRLKRFSRIYFKPEWNTANIIQPNVGKCIFSDPRNLKGGC